MFVSPSRYKMENGMEEKNVFRGMLNEVTSLARKKGGSLSREEIDEIFADFPLTPEQKGLVYEYLHNQQITVEGYESAAKTVQTEKKPSDGEIQDPEEEEEALDESGIPLWLDAYLEEIEQSEELSPAEEFALFTAAVRGERQARDRLAARYLQMVFTMAAEYEGKDCPFEDLIQEGNVGLLLALDGLREQGTLAAYQAQLMNEVSRHMQEAIREHDDDRKKKDGLVQRVSRLSQAIDELEEDLGHKVSVGELSAFLDMPAEEILDTLKMAGDKLKVER